MLYLDFKEDASFQYKGFQTFARKEKTMETKVNMVASRRGFIATFFGLLPGIVLANPRRLQAAKPEIRKLLCQMDLDMLISSRPARDPSVICRTFGDRNTLFRKKGDKTDPVCGMNQMGKKIWEACDGRNSPEEITGMINKEYTVSKDKAWTDTLFFLVRLKKLGVIL